MKLRIVLLVAALTLATAASPALADEGMWLLSQLARLDQGELQAMGLTLTPTQIWDPDSNTGLASAVCSLGGCSASFVSANGLIATNHHCAFRAIQLASSPENDYLSDGFLAAERAAEVEARGYRVYVFKGYEDVTARVTSALEPDMTPASRVKAIEHREKELVAACEAPGNLRCSIGEMFGGLDYVLFRSMELRDVRLVYAPARSIGEFGGDIDNWMWPRHTGDFSFLRAYVAPDGSPADFAPENVPYHPQRWLTLSSAPLAEGDFVMIMGYPGRTYRHRFADAVAEDVAVNLPYRIDLYTEWIDLLDTHAASSKEVAIKVSSTVKGLNNSMKKYRGLLEGFARYDLVESKRASERKLGAWISGDPERTARFGDLLRPVEALYRARRGGRERDIVLETLPRAGTLLPTALTLERWTAEKGRQDIDRKPGYQSRDEGKLRQRLALSQRTFDPAVDEAVIALFLRRAASLPPERRIEAIDALLAATGVQDDAAVTAAAARLVRGTKLADTGVVMRLFDGDHSTLAAGTDPLLALALALRADTDALEMRDDAFEGELLDLTSRSVEAHRERDGALIYPDANSTLRFTYATVAGYSPRDAVDYLPFTTLAGVTAKCTAEEPFTCPAGLLEAAAQPAPKRYVNPTAGDVPSCFLTTNDITGGNSGSPMMNGQGELVGLAFDGNYEALTGDYLFDRKIQRTIGVDVAYILWVMDLVDHAHTLMREMGVEPTTK